MHGFVDAFAFDEVDHYRQAGLRNGAAMAVPYQTLDSVRFVVGNLDMHGRFVAAGRIELVGFAGRAVQRTDGPVSPFR